MGTRRLKIKKKSYYLSRLTLGPLFKFRPITFIDKGGNFDEKCGFRVYK